MEFVDFVSLKSSQTLISHKVNVELKTETSWECKLVQSLWKTVWGFFKKLKIQLPYDPAIALLGIYPRDDQVCCFKGTHTPQCL